MTQIPGLFNKYLYYIKVKKVKFSVSTTGRHSL